MPLNRNTMMRIRVIDACLQRRQRRWTLEDLQEACQDALYEYEGIESVSLRTIQRDIELMRSDKLGYYAPIVVVDRKYYMYDDPNFSIVQLPLSDKDIEKLSSAMDIIRHYQGFHCMQGQEDVLTRMQDGINSQRNQKQAVFIETNTQLKGLNFLSPLYDFIIKEQTIVVHYQSFKSKKKLAFMLSPYFLKEFNNRWFVVGYNHKLKDVQTLALDRMISLEKSENAYIANTFFDAQQYLDSMVGVSRALHTKTQRVVLWVDADQAPYVITKPLHVSQQVIKTYDDGSIKIVLNVVLNYELERLIMGFGSHVKVLIPQQLKKHIAEHVRIMNEMYV